VELDAFKIVCLPLQGLRAAPVCTLSLLRFLFWLSPDTQVCSDRGNPPRCPGAVSPGLFRWVDLSVEKGTAQKRGARDLPPLPTPLACKRPSARRAPAGAHWESRTASQRFSARARRVFCSGAAAPDTPGVGAFRRKLEWSELGQVGGEGCAVPSPHVKVRTGKSNFDNNASGSEIDQFLTEK